MTCPRCGHDYCFAAGTAGAGLGNINQCGRCYTRFFDSDYNDRWARFQQQLDAEHEAYVRDKDRGDE